MKHNTSPQISDYQQFAQDKLGFKFNNPELLVTALTHRSYVNEHRQSAQAHNERLEFLGDAVLELVVSDYLYRNFDQPEGIMTSWRSALVRTESICAAGEELGYEPLIRLSRGEKNNTDRAHQSIVADCFEAVIGATYLDQGYPTAVKLIEDHILSRIEQIRREGSWRDPKSYFQEIAQHIDGEIPEYKLITEGGPDHNKTFSVGLFVNDALIATGFGHSKQEAQTKAATDAIKEYTKRYPDQLPL